MGQLAQSVGRRDEGKLPSQPVNNPRGQYGVESSNANDHFQEQAKAITTLRSGKEVNYKVEYQKDDELVRSPNKGKAPVVNLSKGDSSPPSPLMSVPMAPYVPKAPYPTALADSTPFGKKGASDRKSVV